MKNSVTSKDFVAKDGAGLLGWLVGKPVVIINHIGISCIGWPFTLIPWADIRRIGIGQTPITNLNNPTTVLRIFLDNPGAYKAHTFQFSVSIPNFIPSYIYEGARKIKDGSNGDPIMISFRGLSRTALEALKYVEILKPTLVDYQIDWSKYYIE